MRLRSGEPTDRARLRPWKMPPKSDGHRAGNALVKAIEYQHRNHMYVIGGLIVGSPDDTRQSIEANLAFARRNVDWPYIQHPTPYPRTPMTQAFRAQGLIVNQDVAAYDGTTAVVRTQHMLAEEVEFLRWRAERWMKLRHGLPQSPLILASCCATHPT